MIRNSRNKKPVVRGAVTKSAVTKPAQETVAARAETAGPVIEHHERTSREQDSRFYGDVHPEYDPSWEPPKQTSGPPPRPGMEQLWVRTTLMGMDDSANVHQHLMEGWKPRSAASVPKGFYCSKAVFGDYGDVIANKDSILMERPQWMGDKVRASQASQSRAKVKGIAQYVRGRMPSNRNTHGADVEINIRTERGRTPKIADD